MAKKRRFAAGLVIFGVACALMLMLALIGRYERNRRVDREAEYRDKLTTITDKVSNLDTVRRLPMMFNERVQPLDSVARRIVRQLSGRRKIYGQDPTLVFLSMALDYETLGWRDIPILSVLHGENRGHLGMHSADTLATVGQHEEFAASTAGQELLAGIGEKISAATGLSQAERELLDLGQKSRWIEGGFDTTSSAYPAAFMIGPPWASQVASDDVGQLDWHPVVARELYGHPKDKVDALVTTFDDFKSAWRNRDQKGVDVTTDRLTALVTELGGEHMLAQDDVDAELTFNRIKPNVNASWLYFAAAAAMIFGVAFHVGWLRGAAILFGILGLAMQGWGFYQRTVLGFGVTITNLYESMISLAAASMLLCVVFNLKQKNNWFTVAGGLAAFFVLQLVDHYSSKFDDGIGGTIAVLANNFWVHIHVPVVMTSYAAFLIAWLLAAAAVVWILFFDRSARSPDLRSLMQASIVGVNVGTLLIFAGMVLGGIWAHDSWGRFWGWDPKETWSFILFVWFLIIVHGRYTKWMNTFWQSLATFLGGLVLLWAYYGTNELLGGLHSYANSAEEGSTFWSNLVHDRNRWFLVTTCVMLGLTGLAAGLYVMTTGRKYVPSDDMPPVDTGLKNEPIGEGA